MELKIMLQKDLYDWVVKTAEESYKTIDRFIEDALWFYKDDVENTENPIKDRNWRLR